MNISFDKKYKKNDFYLGSKPSKIIIDILNYKSAGDVLDLGVGEGRNAIFLAKKGFKIDGIDKSKEGIKKFINLTKKEMVSIHAIAGLIEDFNYKKDYDIIISTATLHFLEKENILNVIKKMKEHTKKDGLNVITVFTEENPDKRFPYLFKKGKLKEFYNDWEILNYKEIITKPEKHGDGPLHHHVIASLIARKKRNDMQDQDIFHVV